MFMARAGWPVLLAHTSQDSQSSWNKCALSTVLFFLYY